MYFLNYLTKAGNFNHKVSYATFPSALSPNGKPETEIHTHTKNANFHQYISKNNSHNWSQAWLRNEVHN